jgi:hypothetical protein
MIHNSESAHLSTSEIDEVAFISLAVNNSRQLSVGSLSVRANLRVQAKAHPVRDHCSVLVDDEYLGGN